jgi:hypothetical protein
MFKPDKHERKGGESEMKRSNQQRFPDKILPAVRWVIIGIVPLVLALGISDTLREGKRDIAGIYSALFVVTFLIAVKWHWIADRCRRLAHFIESRRVTMFYIGLAVICALGLGIAVGKLMGRTSDAASTNVTSTAVRKVKITRVRFLEELK